MACKEAGVMINNWFLFWRESNQLKVNFKCSLNSVGCLYTDDDNCSTIKKSQSPTF